MLSSLLDYAVAFGWCLLVINIPFLIQGLLCYLYVTITGKRLHYIEFHEQEWFPSFITKHCTIHLKGGWEMYGLPSVLGGLSPARTLGHVIYHKFIHSNLKLKQRFVILDMMSGASGPTYSIHQYLFKQLKLANVFSFVSDLKPQIEVWQNLTKTTTNFGFFPFKVDATRLNESVHEIRTIGDNALWSTVVNGDKTKTMFVRSVFGSWHHLNEAQCVDVLYDAIVSNDCIIISEKMLSRESFVNIIKWPIVNILAFPVQVCYNVYFVLFQDFEPLTIQKLCAVLLVQPLVFLLKIHDMITSANRTYNEEEMLAMARIALDKANKNNKKRKYKFEYWKQPTMMMAPFDKIATLNVFVGTPADACDTQ
eukprot:489776_1